MYVTLNVYVINIIVLQTVQVAKEEITGIESAGYISFLTNTNYSKFQGKNVSVNYPSKTVKERLQNGKSSYYQNLHVHLLVNVGENTTFINMIFSNLGDFLTAENNR